MKSKFPVLVMSEKDIQRIVDHVFEHGKEYIPAPLPSDVSRGEPGQCFDCSILNALRSEYRYVEGVALNPVNKNEWIYHAWLTDGFYAYDPTWEARSKTGKTCHVVTRYQGVELDAKTVAKFMLCTKHTAIFANYDKALDIAQKLVPRYVLSGEF